MSSSTPSDPKVPPSTTAELEQLCNELEMEIGLELRARDRRRIEQGVAERMRRLRLTRLSDYLPHLRTDAERNALIRIATIAESWFFRDTGQMRLIRHLLLPQLIAARQTQRRLRLWSAGCAGGQEAWSLAMLVAEALPEASRWEVLILGTDINADALASANDGVYTSWTLRGLNEISRDQFFTPASNGAGNRSGDGWRVGETLRRWVRFAPDNLIDGGPPPIQDVDLVLCRNVLIYSQRERLPRVMQRLGAALRPEGLLVAGHCELLDVANDCFATQQFPEGLVYRRTSASGPAAAKAAAAAAGAVSPEQLAIPAIPASGGTPRSTPRASVCRAEPSATTRTMAGAAATAPSPAIMHQTDSLAAAETCAARGDYARACDLAREAQRAAPLDYRPVYLLAQLAEIEGDNAEALRRLSQVLYLAPDFVPACLDTAAHLERLGETDRAMRHRRAARRLLEAQPDEQAMEPPYQDIRVGTLKAYLDELLNTVDARQDMIGSDTQPVPPPER